MSKLLNNLPIGDLTVDNDYLGIIDKGQIIKTFLESNTDQFEDIKMFSLYGEWGSGKSTLMKYLQKELKENFNTFFFEAWQFESDSNLSLSLLEYLSYKSADSTDEALGEIVEIAAKLLRGFSKSVRISVPGLSIDGNKIVESLEEEPEETFYQLKQKFETEFRKWESHVTKGKSPKYNIVFIDDLDRCEPVNVLNLLSALKLFFTYGQKTIFFCGIDQKAVKEAVKTKYGEIVKANEYLEKVFDISFSMPKYDNILKLVSQYFDEREVLFLGGELNHNIALFLKELNFTNPRRVKKLLNKYSIYRNLKEELHHNHEYGRFMANIYTENDGDYFETILTLQIIILYEFYPNLFEKLFDLKYKELILIEAVKNSSDISNTSSYLGSIKHYVDLNHPNKSLRGLNFKNPGQKNELIFSLLPNNIIELGTNDFGEHGFQYMKVEQINIEYKFLSYLLMNYEKILSSNEMVSDLSLNQIKETVRNIL